ncbi:hypothetical protein OROGR_002702 [Orobanche gracilis]
MSTASAAIERPRIGTSNTGYSRTDLCSYLLKDWDGRRGRSDGLSLHALLLFSSRMILLSALSQRGGEVNLTLGGIDLNNSGSVVVREDKKLLTILFPDGRDGRAFTLKAETSEDLSEWKTALENAMAQAPNAALLVGQNGKFRSDTNDSLNGSFHQRRERRPMKSLVVGRPILLALEDIDGGPSFLEKALRFLEKYGIRVEGILRQSADVEEVDRRVQEYEQGKTEFDPNEDVHVTGDCIKHVLRELPSSPVPASCCTALLESFKIHPKEAQVNAMRFTIQEAFPEPNRRLLQRVLKMMHTVSSHASENRMTPSAVAACMAPLLLRPLLAGECELEEGYDINGDNPAQLLAAANAANIAQTIITTLVEEYDNIFEDDTLHRCSVSVGSQTEKSSSEDSSDDEITDIKVNSSHDTQNEVDHEAEFDSKRLNSGKLSENSGFAPSDPDDYKAMGNNNSDDGPPSHNRSFETKSYPTLESRARNDSVIAVNDRHENMTIGSSETLCFCKHQAVGNNDSDDGSSSHNRSFETKLYPTLESIARNDYVIAVDDRHENMTVVSSETLCDESQQSISEFMSSITINQGFHQYVPGPKLSADKAIPKPTDPNNGSAKMSPFWVNKNARRTPSTDSVDYSGEEEVAIQRLEIAKDDLRHRIAKEARGNAILQASLDRRKQALHERRLALEQDVARLQEQLQAERDLRVALEAGLSMSSGQSAGSRDMDSKTRAELEEIALAEADVTRLKQKVAELHNQLNQQHGYGSLPHACDPCQQPPNQSSHQKYFQQDFDTTLAVYKTETKQSTEVVDYPRHPSAASSTLVELTTRLDFFKERRSQLMEQLQNLDLNYGSRPHQDFVYKPSSPTWS